MTTLEIPINKFRIAVLSFLFIAVITLGVLLSYYLFLDGHFSIKLIMILVIAIPIAIFVIWFAIKKIISNNPGLVLDSRGVLDNVNLSETGIIPWNNISQINMVNHQSSYFIILHLKNSDNVLNRLQNNRLRLAKNNMKVFGSPVAINASNLKIDRFELLEILNKETQAWNNKNLEKRI